MRDFIEPIVKALVDHPAEVVLKESALDDRVRIVRVFVCEEDRRHIIGSNGRMVQALRVIAASLAKRRGIDLILIISEE